MNNDRHQLFAPVGYIVYKEHDGLSTFYVKHKRDLPKPNYPMPAIPTRVEYVFGYGLADGIFVRVSNWIVAGAYADGMQITYPIEN